MSSFDPAVVLNNLRSHVPAGEREAFTQKWTTNIRARVDGWQKNRLHNSILPQTQWEAAVVEYVNFVYKETRIHGNAKNISATRFKPLKHDIPLYGPRFIPPGYLDLQKRSSTPIISPQTMYMRPLTVVHPFYFRQSDFQKCPVCSGFRTRWDGWTTTGHRDVHGVQFPENALGYQLRCDDCEEREQHKPKRDRGPHCFAATSALFWAKREPWEVASEIPHFSSRDAVTRELFNMLIELRLTSTASGLAENVKQLHLEHYHQRRRTYYQAINERLSHPSNTFFPQLQASALLPFSAPDDKDEYNAMPITNDMISEVYADFCKRTRQAESDQYLKTLIALIISMDNTYRAAKKASVINPDKGREVLMKGGILSMLNELNEIMSWRFCQSNSTTEMSEMLQGLVQRCKVLGVSEPVQLVVDNCCKMRNAVVPTLTSCNIVLDVYHFKKRYTICVLNGTKNPYYLEVGKDIVDAILKARAEKGKPALYWPKEEQVKRIQAAYQKWLDHGGVWSAAAPKAHAEQLRHVQKGCLARSREDIPSDGSRIEGSHKGWNSLMRSFASGFENMRYLCHDFVLRRNIRAAIKHKQNRDFALSGYGSHHISLVNAANCLWNTLLDGGKGRQDGVTLGKLPVLAKVNSGEVFGVVSSACAATFNGLIKDEEEEDDLDLLGMRLYPEDEGISPEEAAQHMNIDPALLMVPAPQLAVTSIDRAIPSSADGRVAHPSGRSVPADVIDVDCIDIDRKVDVKTPAFIDLTLETLDGRMAACMRPIAAPVARSSTVRHSNTSQLGSEDISTVESSTRDLPTSRKRKTSAHTAQVSVKRPRVQVIDPRILAMREEEEESESEAEDDSKISPAASTESQDTPISNVPISIDVVYETGESLVNVACGARSNRIAALVTDPLAAGNPAVASTSFVGVLSSQSTATRPSVDERVPATGIERFLQLHGKAPASASHPPPSVSIDSADRRSREKLLKLLEKVSLPVAGRGLTRSQALFSKLTALDARKLKIDGDVEFFLFMDMRSEHGWASFSMTAFKWVRITEEYNRRLVESNRTRGLATIKKHPRALMEKLENVEKQVLSRIARQNYTSRTGGTEFWTKHCFAVQLGKDMDEAKRGHGRSRKSQVCKRCKTLMYPCEKGHPDNHKRDYCSDGAPSSSAHIPFPQPEGVFAKGKTFDVVPFFNTVQDLYQLVVVEGVSRDDLSIDTEAFATMLMDRMEHDKGGENVVSFRLLEGISVLGAQSIADFIFEVNGQAYLRIGCL